MTGINIEIVEQAALSLGVPSRSDIIPLKRAMKMIEQPGNFLVGLARTPDRESHFNWIAPLVPTRIGMLSWEDGSISSSPLRGEICVHYSTPMESWLKQHNHPDYIVVKNEDACLKLLTNHLVKYWFTEFHLAHYLIQQQGLDNNHLIENEVIMEPHLYMASSLNTPDSVIHRWRNQLEEMRKNGLFEKTIRRYINDY